MELKSYISILKRQWKVVLMVTTAVGVMTIVASMFLSPMYHAQARLRVATPVGGALGEISYQTTFAIRLMNTYVQMATSEQMMSDLREMLELEELPSINVKIVPDSEVIQIDVEDDDPVQAARVANGLAELLIAKSRFHPLENGTTSEELNILINRRDELEKGLSEANQEHDRLVGLYSATTAKISILDRTIRLRESSYSLLENSYEEALVENAVSATARSKLTIAALDQAMTRMNNEIQTLNNEYEEILAASNEYMQQIVMIRQTIAGEQSAYSDLLYRIDSFMVANSRQENSQGMVIISQAVAATSPGGTSRIFVILLGWVCGLIVGVIAGFMSDNLSGQFHRRLQHA